MKTCSLIPAAALALASCTLGPDFQLPDLTGGSKWKETQAVSGTRLGRLGQEGDLDITGGEFVNR